MFSIEIEAARGDIQGLAVVSVKRGGHAVEEFTFDIDTLTKLLRDAAELVATTVADGGAIALPLKCETYREE